MDKINFLPPLLQHPTFYLPLSLSLPCPVAAAALLPWQQPVCEHKGVEGVKGGYGHSLGHAVGEW